MRKLAAVIGTLAVTGGLILGAGATAMAATDDDGYDGYQSWSHSSCDGGWHHWQANGHDHWYRDNSRLICLDLGLL